jgi:hypothetical protein
MPDWLMRRRSQAMTAHDGSDFGSRNDFFNRRASWPDVWAGLALTLVVGTGAVFAVALLSDGPPAAPKVDRQDANTTFRLMGIQDPSRPGWRATNGSWDRAGAHETVPDASEDRAGGDSGERR